jgi:hypothetical protein
MKMTLHEKVEWLFGSGDLRLLYGMAAPVLLVCGLVALFAVTSAWWLVATLMLVIFAMVGVVLAGLGYMLGETGDEDDR